MSPALHTKASFAATMDGVAAAAEWLRDVATRERLSDKLSYALELCLEELGTNVARHGRTPGAGGTEPPLTLEISLLVDAHGDAELILEDNARPFDVSRAVGRPIRRPLSEVLPGGLGIQLVRSFSDELLYEPTENGNRVIVKFLRQSEGKSKAAV